MLTRDYVGLIRVLSKYLDADQLIEHVARLKLTDAQAAAAIVVAANLPRGVEVDHRPLRECIGAARMAQAKRLLNDPALRPAVNEHGPFMQEQENDD